MLWVDILKYFGLNLPLSEDNFILLTNETYEYCTKFVNFMLELEEYKFIKRNDGILLEAWIIENKIKCKLLDLFGNTYIIINPKQLDLYVDFIQSTRKNVEILKYFRQSIISKLSKEDHETVVEQSRDLPSCSVDSIVANSETGVIPVSELAAMDCIDSETPELNFVDEVVIDSKVPENVIDGNFFLNLDEWNSLPR